MQNQNKKIIFFGTPDVCITILENLISSGFTISAIVCNPDRPVGRKNIITPPPSKVWGEAHSIPVLQPEKIDDDFISEIEKIGADIFVVVAYGRILPEKLINMPAFGTINIHYSLLPKYRGATPVEQAILNGDEETGVCIQKMVYELDAGDILASEKIATDEHEKAYELRTRLNIIAGGMLVEMLPKYFNNEISAIPQTGEISKCGKIKKSDGLITEEELKNAETNIEIARNLYNKFRAYTPWPSLFFFHEGKRIKITDAILENEKFIIKKIIPEGGKEMDYKVFSL